MVHDLPGAGRNLQDHVDCVLSFECRKPVTLYRHLRADRLALSVARGTVFGEGVMTTFPYEAGAFLKTRPELIAPDLQLHFMPALDRQPAFPEPLQAGRRGRGQSRPGHYRSGRWLRRAERSQ